MVHKIFRTAVDLMSKNNLNVKVEHVAGDRNIVADILSRNNIANARSKIVNLDINNSASSPAHMDNEIKRQGLKSIANNQY